MVRTSSDRVVSWALPGMEHLILWGISVRDLPTTSCFTWRGAIEIMGSAAYFLEQLFERGTFSTHLIFGSWRVFFRLDPEK